MNYRKRILKTGALASAVTVAFIFFVYRTAEWSEGMGSKAIALNEEKDFNCPGAPGTPLQTKVIPQVPLNSFDSGLTTYSTVVQVVNTTEAVQNIAATFYKEDGKPLDDIRLTAGTSTMTNGILETSIAQNGVLVISGGGTDAPGTIAWGKIRGCSGLSVSSFFELRNADNFLLSRVGIAPSLANMSSFLIPRVREVGKGLDVAFALVNTASSGSATLKAELKDAAGNTIATKEIAMAGGQHRAGFMNELFAPLDETNRTRLYQYVEFSSTSPTFAAIALAFEGSTQTSLPVDVLQ